MMKKTRSKGIWKRTALDGLFYLLGSVLYALSVNIFTAPNQIAPGGVTGVATLFNFAWGLPIGTMILVINLPLLIASWFRLGKAFTIRTLIVTVLSSVVSDAAAPFLPPFRGDRMLVALFGGVLAGAGLGLIYMRGATTGGTEVDLNADTPYNTRTHKGLTPTAIASPGVDALKAAVYPDSTRYYFYALGDDGKHHFFATYREQQNFIASQERYQNG